MKRKEIHKSSPTTCVTHSVLCASLLLPRRVYLNSMIKLSIAQYAWEMISCLVSIFLLEAVDDYIEITHYTKACS